MKYLDTNGLNKVLTKFKTFIDTKADSEHTHNTNDIVGGAAGQVLTKTTTGAEWADAAISWDNIGGKPIKLVKLNNFVFWDNPCWTTENASKYSYRNLDFLPNITTTADAITKRIIQDDVYALYINDELIDVVGRLHLGFEVTGTAKTITLSKTIRQPSPNYWGGLGCVSIGCYLGANIKQSDIDTGYRMKEPDGSAILASCYNKQRSLKIGSFGKVSNSSTTFTQFESWLPAAAKFFVVNGEIMIADLGLSNNLTAYTGPSGNSASIYLYFEF